MPLKYTKSIIINKPIGEVWEFFLDGDKAYLWQPTLQSMNVLEGELGEEGSRTRMRYKMNDQSQEIEEVITRKREYIASFIYYSKGIVNNTVCEFRKLNDICTEFSLANEFIFTNWKTKLIGVIMAGVFKSETEQTLEQFKTAVEGQ